MIRNLLVVIAATIILNVDADANPRLYPETIKKYYKLGSQDKVAEVKSLRNNSYEVKIVLATGKCFKKRLKLLGSTENLRIIELHREMDCDE